MGQQDNGQVENSLTELMRFLATPERPISSGEFKEFWESCSEEEKEEFRRTELK